jgi:hypothetical protein
MDDQKQANQSPERQAPSMPAGVSRRALLGFARSAAVPAIVTLYSGAALARSSNLIGTNPNQGPEYDKYRCLDTSSVYPTDKPHIYDLGEDPMAHVTRIDARKRYYRADWRGYPTRQQVSDTEMCEDGGQYYRQDWGSYKKVTVRKGVLVSATALSSFANDITYTDV